MEQQAHGTTPWATRSTTTNPTMGTVGGTQYKWEDEEPRHQMQSNSTMTTTPPSRRVTRNGLMMLAEEDPMPYNIKNVNDNYHDNNSLWSAFSGSSQEPAPQATLAAAGASPFSAGHHHEALMYYHTSTSTPASAPRTISTSMVTPTSTLSTSSMQQPRVKLGRRPSPGVLLARVKPMDFAERIYTMLEDAERENFESVIRWEPDGKSFKVHDTRAFEEEIQPRYLNQTKLRSFQRKLILHGFSRIQGGPSLGAYHHRFLIRGERFLCRRIQRQDQQEKHGATTTNIGAASEDFEDCSSSLGSITEKKAVPPRLPSMCKTSTTSSNTSSASTTPLLSNSSSTSTSNQSGAPTAAARMMVGASSTTSTTREPMELTLGNVVLNKNYARRGATSPSNTLPVAAAATFPLRGVEGAGGFHHDQPTSKNNQNDDTATTRWLFERMLDSYKPRQLSGQNEEMGGHENPSLSTPSDSNEDPFSPRPLP